VTAVAGKGDEVGHGSHSILTLPYGRYARKSLVDLVNWKEFTM